LVTILEDFLGSKRPGNGLAGLLGVVPLEVEKLPINEENIRLFLGFAGITPADSDVKAITTAVSRWDLTIYEAIISRNKENARKAMNQVSQASRALATLRDQLAPTTRGAANQTVTATIDDPRLKESLGESIRLQFADGNWNVASFNGDDVDVLLSGEYDSMSGTRAKAPLLAKFREGKGTVIFTSFHNESQNSEKELDLLRYLVFSAVTAEQDALAQESMLSGGFSPVKQSQINHGAGNASVTKAYTSADSGPLRFALTFNGRGANLRLTLIAPNGQKYAKEVDSTILVEATGAPAGEWTYTVEALKVPYENFPYNVSIGKGAIGTRPKSAR
jgi:F0F1-type ATP synthase epsilon subunit